MLKLWIAVMEGVRLTCKLFGGVIRSIPALAIWKAPQTQKEAAQQLVY